jgi:poly(3-hydroxyalkanoate) depolymerase
MRSSHRPARSRPALRVEHARIGRHRIRYAVRAGDPGRPPLLFFNGIGANIELALPFIDALTGPTVVIFDVPGVGGSPTPRSPYRPRGIARLAAGLLDHLGLDVADALGVSWGGLIAQQFALQHPARCRRLILAATTPGVLMMPARPSVLLKMMTPRRYQDEASALRVAGAIYGGACRDNPDLVSATFRHVRFSSRGGYYLQLAAMWGWSSLPWLSRLRQPTLVMAGTDDPLVPALNAHVLRWLIPDARLEIIDCGHLFLVTRAAESARVVESFLTEPVADAPVRRRRAAPSQPSSSRSFS